MAQGIHNLKIDTTGTEEEVVECLEAVLEMEGYVDGEGEEEGEEEGDGSQMALGAIEFLP